MIVKAKIVIGTVTEIVAMIESVIERGSVLVAMILGVTADRDLDPGSAQGIMIATGYHFFKKINFLLLCRFVQFMLCDLSWF